MGDPVLYGLAGGGEGTLGLGGVVGRPRIVGPVGSFHLGHATDPTSNRWREDRRVRHARFDVASLTVEGVGLPLKAAYLLVAQADGDLQVQWECLAYALDPAPLAPGRYLLDVTTLDGRALRGPAIRVRSVEGAHVFRGDGLLDGVSEVDLG